MNLSTMRSRVAGKIGMSSTEELALIDGWLNEGCEQYLVETKSVVREAELALTAGVSDYVLPDSVLAFAHAWIAPGNGGGINELERVDFSDSLRRRFYNAAGPYSRTYELRGNMIFLDPAPSSGDKLKMIYVPAPTPMVLNGDSPSASGIPTRDHPIIEAYASWKAADWDDDTSSKIGQNYMQEYEMGIRKVKMRRNRMGGGWGPARPARGRAWVPRTPGTDIPGY